MSRGFFLLSVVVVGSQGYLFNQSSLYAGLAARLASYFTSACIYIITDSRNGDEVFFEQLLKKIAFTYNISTNLYSFEEYHDYQKQVGASQCSVPLQVVISHDEITRLAFQEHSHRATMHGPDSYGGGVWLVFVDSVEQDFLHSYFENISTPFDSEIIAAKLKTRKWGQAMSLREVYRVREEFPLRTPRFGMWPEHEQWGFPETSLVYSRRSDLEGVDLQVGFIESPPFTVLETVNGQPVLNGFLGEVWGDMQTAINATSTMKAVKNYGHEKPKGGWSGLIGAVQKGELDAGIADFALTPKRFEVIQYSRPLLVTDFQIFYHSTGSTVEAEALFLPLSNELWLCILAWMVIASLLLFLGCHLSDKNLGTRENMSYTSAFFIVTGALCAQGSVDMPKRMTCRVLFVASFLITAVIIPSYSASLMSYLTVTKSSVPFTSIKEFYKMGNIKMTVKYSSYEYDLFAHECTNGCYMSKIYERDIKPVPKIDFPPSNRLAVRAVCHNRNVAYFGLTNAVLWAIDQEIRMEGSKRSCTVSKMPFDAGKVNLGVAFPRDSHYRLLINHHLHHFGTHGLLKRFQMKNWPITSTVLTVEEHYPVGISNVFMMFVILGCGMVLALSILMVEMVVGRKKKVKGAVSKMANFMSKSLLIKTKFNLEGIRRKEKTMDQTPGVYFY